MFTTVLDVLPLGLVDEDEEVRETTDRGYWEQRGTKVTLGLADQMLTLVQGIDSSLDLKYNKFYIGVARDGSPQNFVTLKPKKKWMDAELRLPRSDEFEARVEGANLDVDYDPSARRYRVRLTQGDVKTREGILKEILQEAFDFYNG